MTCEFKEGEPFYCATCKCGVKRDGEIKPCRRPGCLHCGKGSLKRPVSQRQYERWLKEHLAAQDAVIRWEDRLGKALGRLVRARKEERLLRLKLEKAEREGVEQPPLEDQS